RRQQEFKEKSILLAESLDVEDVIAQLLVTDGYTTVESIATETLDNLEKIEGFDSELANEIILRAKQKRI
ncbi:MAG: transcription termination/antitermination protein NusA, partial [Flavobacteriaceae bacterium]|nr:transcription termination/antitermination protein NusA [Flavobacteriaceae bacterium]